MSDPLVLIPARLAATRLPNKPLADIAGEPMIVHVWRRAVEAGIGPVAVATDAPEIAEAVAVAGGTAVMTRADHASGSDRIFEAVEKLDPEGRHDVIVNVQGDIPTIDPAAISASISPLLDPAVDLATLVARIEREEERTNPNVVKMVGSEIARAGSAPSISPAQRRPMGTGRSIITSGSMLTAATPCGASSACRPLRWRSARSWNNCGRWRRACASTPSSWTTCRSASIPLTIWKGRAR
jgi:3-deoxy-manno-octulosonate cytidylyltransferase (CMP-KDO synthetase)